MGSIMLNAERLSARRLNNRLAGRQKVVMWGGYERDYK